VTGADPVYTEKHSALTWTGMILGLLYLTAGAAVVLVTFVLSLTDNKVIFLLTLAALWWELFWLRYLRRAWPTGIWVNEAGIRVGDARALPYATSDSQTVFTCSWTAVRRIVLTSRVPEPWSGQGHRHLVPLAAGAGAAVAGGAGHPRGPCGARGPAGGARGQRVQLRRSPGQLDGVHPASQGAVGRPGPGPRLPAGRGSGRPRRARGASLRGRVLSGVVVCAGELGADLAGVGVLQVLEDGQRLLPGLLGLG
jgi:hypothetical protein